MLYTSVKKRKKHKKKRLVTPHQITKMVKTDVMSHLIYGYRFYENDGRIILYLSTNTGTQFSFSYLRNGRVLDSRDGCVITRKESLKYLTLFLKDDGIMVHKSAIIRSELYI